MSALRIVMMGTGPFAVPSFRCLVESAHDVVALVTRPIDESRARRKTTANPMRDAAREYDLETVAPDSINDQQAQEMLRGYRADLFVVCDYGQILSAETLGLAPLGGVNLHGSLLPRYRGAAPVNWAVLNGDTETGVTVIHMTPGLDAGPCLVKVATPIALQDDAAILEDRLSRLGVGAVMEAVEMLARWDRQSVLGEIQDSSLSCKAPRLKKSDGRVDWRRSAVQIVNQVRGLKPWPATHMYWTNPKGREVRILLEHVQVFDGAERAGGEPGEVVVSDKHELIVATGEGLLRILELQPAGKKAMPIDVFLRGHHIAEGDRLD